jgi:predicted RNA-binding protein YlqC (UPF0109 family)
VSSELISPATKIAAQKSQICLRIAVDEQHSFYCGTLPGRNQCERSSSSSRRRKEVHGDTASVLELRVAKEDLGRVIGKQGRTVNSVRTILNAVASRTNRKVVLEIIEER